ncbi:MAG TPA: TlpA disulfide reductase family protein [Acidimicrobiales bacterium]|nr:TlpA disulfide reductase family protein [Acidimicrobiales bacterium]
MALAVIVGVVVAQQGSPSGAGGGLDPAPAIRLPSVRGGPAVDLAGLRGTPVVVNFFASWCVPCRKELPHFRAASARLEGRVAFVGVAHQDDADLADRLLREFAVTYPAGNDPDGGVARRYHLRGMPSTAFVTADGRLFGVAAGQLDDAELAGWIDRLLRAGKP